MNAKEPLELLLCTNGAETTRPGIEYGQRLAHLLRAPVSLLGIVERTSQTAEVEHLLQQTVDDLTRQHVAVETRLVTGYTEAILPGQARLGHYWTVLGNLGRPFWKQYLTGKPFRHMLADLYTPLIYVPQLSWPIQRLLVCAGGLAYADSLEEVAYALAEASGAAITILHVVGPINLDYPLAHTIARQWKDLLETDTPQGNNLRLALQRAQARGLQAEVKIRRGDVIHEILNEIQTEKYDLVGLGSPYSAHNLRHLYSPNVTAEVAEAVAVPVLTVRNGYQLPT